MKIALAELRKKKGLTQKEIAEKLGTTAAAIGMWETGKREPNISTILRLSEILDCTTDRLLGKSVKVKIKRR